MVVLRYMIIENVVGELAVSCEAVRQALAGGEPVVMVRGPRYLQLLYEDNRLYVIVADDDIGVVGGYEVLNSDDVIRECS